MNVAMHCVYFPPEVGGLESHVYYLCRGLVKKGCRVSIVTSRSQPELPAHEVVEGIDVWRTWLPRRDSLGWAAHGGWSTPRLTLAARGADVVHAQAFQSVLPGVVAKTANRIPLVSTWHTSHFLKRARSPFWRPIFQRLLAWSDYNLAASTEIAGVAEGLAPGVSVEPLTNGVETDIFHRCEPSLPAAARRRVIVPRRLFEKNGVEFFIRAMPLIVERVNIEAVIVGDGPERDHLEELVGSLGLADRVQFLGARRHDEMPGLLSSAELAVFPSLMEATSVAALESMACELPVAASNVGGLPEIVDDEVGALFEAGNPTTLAAAVTSLLERDDLRALGTAARSRVVERWSNARLVDRHLEVYESLISRGRERGRSDSADVRDPSAENGS
jgi:glycosyltransferase involved in cell wall biosynthesis